MADRLLFVNHQELGLTQIPWFETAIHEALERGFKLCDPQPDGSPAPVIEPLPVAAHEPAED